MKKSLLALAVLTGFAGVASAQSSVTLFGVIDANVRNIKNGGSNIWQEGTDGYNSSRLGFRGTEDLGGGLKAGFWLEAGLNPDEGTINSSGKFWHRRSTVSLESATLGEVRLGRDFTPTYTAMSAYDAFGDNGVGKFSNLQSKLTATVNTNTRADNEVQYFLPKNIGGVYGSVAVAAGEGTVGNKYVGGRLGFASGGLDVSGAYGTTEANAAADKYKVATAGAAYDFGVVRVMGSFSQIKFLTIKERMYYVGATAPIGQGVLRVSLGKGDLSGGTLATATRDADDITLAAIGYVYNLSKRTALYGTYSRLDNKGASKTAIATSALALAAGQKSTGFELGLRHAF
jgi:predicted porin